MKLFTLLLFVCEKGYILLQNIDWENMVHTITFLVKLFLALQDIWEKVMKQQHPYRSRSSHPEVFLRKGVLKICSKFTGEPPYRSAISIKLQSNFIEIALRHGYSPVNLLHIFRTLFPGNTSGWLLLYICIGLVDIVLWPKTLGNRLSILTSVLVVFDYFFRCQKSTYPI